MNSGLRGVRRMLGVVGVIGACGLAAAPTFAQEAQPYTKGTVLVIDTAAFNRMLPDAKDAGLVKAIGMFPARVNRPAISSASHRWADT